MTENTNGRDIRHELSDVIALLGSEYETTTVHCYPEDSAIRITRQGSNQSMYFIADGRPNEIQMRLYDEDTDFMQAHCIFYDDTFNDLTPNYIADGIRALL